MPSQKLSPYLQCSISRKAGDRRTYLYRHFLCPY
nr:MAG TPA: hypothetical protein [Caudoviricetes sp.]